MLKYSNSLDVVLPGHKIAYAVKSKHGDPMRVGKITYIKLRLNRSGELVYTVRVHSENTYYTTCFTVYYKNGKDRTIIKL